MGNIKDIIDILKARHFVETMTERKRQKRNSIRPRSFVDSFANNPSSLQGSLTVLEINSLAQINPKKNYPGDRYYDTKSDLPTLQPKSGYPTRLPGSKRITNCTDTHKIRACTKILLQPKNSQHKPAPRFDPHQCGSLTKGPQLDGSVTRKFPSSCKPQKRPRHTHQ